VRALSLSRCCFEFLKLNILERLSKRAATSEFKHLHKEGMTKRKEELHRIKISKFLSIQFALYFL